MANCKYVESCELFTNEEMQERELALLAYRTQYCEGEGLGPEACKRFAVKEKIGTCPPHIKPSATAGVDEIIAEIESK